LHANVTIDETADAIEGAELLSVQRGG
jgi:hypothetical protein